MTVQPEPKGLNKTQRARFDSLQRLLVGKRIMGIRFAGKRDATDLECEVGDTVCELSGSEGVHVALRPLPEPEDDEGEENEG